MSNEELTWEDYFPYKPRELQITMMKVIKRYLKPKAHLVLEASTGIGKTIVNLASLLPYAKARDLKIIYTARTHAQIDRVMEELNKISEIQTVSGTALRGRESFCLNSLVKKYAKTNKAVQVMCAQLKSTNKCEYFVNMKSETRMEPIIRSLTKIPATADHIFDVCQSAGICPAETVRKLMPKIDVIACSYLYIFDPMIRARFLETIDRDLSDLIIVVDEAHNLPDMVANVASDSISSFSFNRAIREADSNRRDDFIKFMESCSNYLNKRAKNLRLYEEVAIDPAKLLEDLELDCEIELEEEFFDGMIELGETIRFRLAKSSKEPRSSLGRIGEFFLSMYNSIGKKGYAHSIEKKRFPNSRDDFVTLNLDSLDSSISILPVLSRVHSSVSVTGTLGDPEAYTLLTGIDQLDHLANIFPSPYNQRNVKTLITRDLTTLYKKRSPEMYKQIVKAICAMAEATPANIGLFTPSYKILNELLSNGLEQLSPKELVITKSGMSSAENDRLITKFKKKAKQDGAILCGVLGGRSSEGADFPGDTMHGVIVVGIPYAPPTVKVKAQIEYLESKFPGKGNMLAYEIPAVNRAAQASGRPVRSLSDIALIMLIDKRFIWPKVSNKLPGWIRTSIEVVDNNPKLISQKVRTFFNTIKLR